MKKFVLYFLLNILMVGAYAQNMRSETYCNPMNLDYTYMVFNSASGISYRSGADPAVVEFRGEYYMFVTRSMGYWHSKDLIDWDFISPGKNWYPQGCNAPAAHNYKDSLLYVCGDPSGSMSILYTDNPKKGDWKATPSILNDLQDPDLFIDDDGKAYMFWGSSNKFPIRGVELDMKNRFLIKGEKIKLFNLDMDKHGWERFGENHADTILGGYIEGPWLTKHNGKYYMQYAAPGTQFNVYGDGVYVANHPMGPYTYQAHNPICYKPGGYMNGAGHGSTVLGPGNNYWHFGSMSFPLNMIWERRLCLYPTYFDKDGIMYSNTRFGDYPHYAPNVPEKHGQFRGWMLLSYNKPVKTSGNLEGTQGSSLVDENSKTYWVSDKNNENAWVIIDLEKTCEINAIQINYNDYKSGMFGRYEGLYHRYTVEGSNDQSDWTLIIDKRNSFKDTPNDYVELDQPTHFRYLRFRNYHVPTPFLSLSAIRVFGKGSGQQPKNVLKFSVNRKKDKRDATINWLPNQNAQGYNIFWGIAPDKLYSTWMVYGDEGLLELKNLNVGQKYYFAIEAFNENGISKLSHIIEVE